MCGALALFGELRGDTVVVRMGRVDGLVAALGLDLLIENPLGLCVAHEVLQQHVVDDSVVARTGVSEGVGSADRAF